MTPEEATRDAHLKRLALTKIYKSVFCDGEGRINPNGQALIEELKSFALVDRPSFRPPWNNQQAAFEEGMRNIILHIENSIAGAEVADPYDDDDEQPELEVKR